MSDHFVTLHAIDDSRPVPYDQEADPFHGEQIDLNVGLFDWFKLVGLVVAVLGSIAIMVVFGFMLWALLAWAVRVIWPVGLVGIGFLAVWGGR